MEIPESTREGILDNLSDLLEAVRDGKLTVEEALDLVAEAVDDAIPTGPFEDLDDGPIRAGVQKLYDLLAPLTRRDPAKIRARADAAELEGNADKAARLRARADRVEARQAT